MEKLQACLLLLLLCICVYTDLKTHKIRNIWVGPGLLLGVWIQSAAAPDSWGGVFLAGMLVPFAILFPVFFFRMIGAGDIKLLMAVGTCIGSSAVLKCMLVTFLMAALYGAAKILFYHHLIIRLQYLAAYVIQIMKYKEWIPYRKEQGGRSHLIHLSVPILLSVILYLGGWY